MGLFLQPARGEAASRDRTLASAPGSCEFWLVTATYVILGTLNTFYQAGAAAAIWLAGYAHDLTGNYRLPLLGSIASVGLAVGCVWLAAPCRLELQRFVQTR